MMSFLKDWNWIISLVVDIILTIALFRLSKKVSFKSKQEHKKEIKLQSDKLLHEIYFEKNRNSKISIIDTSEIKKYPQKGYFKTELLGLNYSGLMCYYKTKKTNNETVYKFGIIPFNKIMDIELETFQDEYETCAKVYCCFRKKI